MTYNVYTDGSYTADIQRFGMGIVIPSLEKVKNNEPSNELIPIGYTLNCEYLDTSIRAQRNIVGELLAVMYAVELMRKHNKECDIIVNHDYTGSAKLASHKFTPSDNNILGISFQLWYMLNHSKNVSFNHTKAHTLYAGNNLADIAAKSGNNGILTPLLGRAKRKANELESEIFEWRFMQGDQVVLSCKFEFGPEIVSKVG